MCVKAVRDLYYVVHSALKLDILSQYLSAHTYIHLTSSYSSRYFQHPRNIAYICKQYTITDQSSCHCQSNCKFLEILLIKYAHDVFITADHFLLCR